MFSKIVRAVECYVRNAAEDIRDIYTISNENGKRLLELNEQGQEYHGEARSWHRDLEHTVKANLSTQERAAKRRHFSINHELTELGKNITNQGHEWRSNETQRAQGNLMKLIFSSDLS